jgi:hypothetical protein
MHGAFQFSLHDWVAVAAAIRKPGLDANPLNAIRHGKT